MIIGPNARVLGTDPSSRLDCGSFGNDQACTVDRETAQVGQVEIGPKAVFARVHAHRCDHDPVGQGQVLDGEGLEEQRHWRVMLGGRGLGGIGVLGQLGAEVGARVGGDGDEEALLRIQGHELGLVMEVGLRLVGGHDY